MTVGQRTSVAATTTLVQISVRSSQSRFNARAAGLLLGFVADRVFADPGGRFHPVAGFGTAAIALQKMSYRDSRAAGTLHVAVLLAGTAGLGLAAEKVSRRAGWVAVTGTTAMATWAVLGGTSLARTGIDMAARLEASQVDRDLTKARELLPSLCGRDPSVLSEEGLTRAALESVAENTSDASVGAMFWGGAIAGVPGLFVYRAANTLDAMIGYRSEKYRRFGWAAARFDDLVNIVPPARLTGALTAACAPVVGGSVQESLAAWKRDAAAHPSPPMRASRKRRRQGALGISLGGRTEYAHGGGDASRPRPRDCADAERSAPRVEAFVGGADQCSCGVSGYFSGYCRIDRQVWLPAPSAALIPAPASCDG